MLINIFSIVTIILFIRYLYLKRSSFLQLGILFAVNLAISYPLRLLIIQFDDNVITDANLDIFRSSLFEISVLSLLGICFFIMGYILIDKRNIQYSYLHPLYRDMETDSFKLVVYLFILSVVAKGIKIAQGNYISFLIGEDINYSYTNILENIHMLGWFAFVGIYFIFFNKGFKRISHYVILFIITATEFSYQIIQGSKTFLTLPIIMLGFSYYHAKKKIPLAIMGIAMTGFVFVIYPFVSSFREAINQIYGRLPRFSEFDIQYILKEAYKGSFEISGGEEYAISKAHSRFSGADELFRITNMVPKLLPYKYGEDFLSLLYTLIPRAIWADKPIFSVGRDYGAVLGTITSVTPFPIGEMYWNFGYPGIVIGMFLWGGFLSFLMRLLSWLYNKHSEARFFITLIFLAQIFWLSSLESALPVMIGSVMKLAVIYLIVFWGYTILLKQNKDKKYDYVNQGASQ